VDDRREGGIEVFRSENRHNIGFAATREHEQDKCSRRNAFRVASAMGPKV
jgi:hypothetical protein